MGTKNPIIAVYTRSGYPSQNVEEFIDDYANTNVNTLILSGPNGYDNGIVYNNPPYTMFDSQGQYVGDASWPASLSRFVAKTNIDPAAIWFSLSNSAISALAAMSASALAGVMTWLKANGIAGIDMDCENWGQPGGLDPMDPACQTVTLAAIAAGLALTAAPYNQQSSWQSWCAFVTRNNGSLSWLNVQCYAGGGSNDPVGGWYTQFNPTVPIVAGFEASPGTDAGALTPDQAKAQLAAWQAETPQNSLAGAFVWDFGLIASGRHTVSQFALAMYAGLTGLHNQVTVTACDNELIVLAYQGNASYELARISSGYSNAVDVTLNITSGLNKGAVVLNGVTSALNSTVTVCVPADSYTVLLIGINWGGPTQFSVGINGNNSSFGPENSPPGVVWTPTGTAIAV